MAKPVVAGAPAKETEKAKVFSLLIGDTEYRTTHDALSVRGVLFLVDNYAKLRNVKRSEVAIKVDGKSKSIAEITSFVNEVRKTYGLAYALQDTNETAKVATEAINEALKEAAKKPISFGELSAGKFDGIVAAAGLNSDFLKALNLPTA